MWLVYLSSRPEQDVMMLWECVRMQQRHLGRFRRSVCAAATSLFKPLLGTKIVFRNNSEMQTACVDQGNISDALLSSVRV